MKDEIAKYAAGGDLEKEETTRQQLMTDRKKLQSELEDKKERIRSGK
jgi:hypothetical protein